MVFIFLMLVANLVQAQNDFPAVKANISRDSINIGGQARIDFTIATSDAYLWQWPEITDQVVKDVEVVSQSAIDTVRQRGSNLITLQKHIVITSFDSGYYAIPPFQYKYRIPGDTTWNLIETQPFLLYVAGVNVDISGSIRDIKDPIGAPLTFLEILPWLLLLVFAIAGIFLYRYYLKKKRAKAQLAPKPPRPKIPPHTRALNALEQLRQKKLWQNGQIKEYHSELTDILRHYIEERYDIMAIEMTSSEILDAINEKLLPALATNKLTTILQRADLVKFAKGNPLPDEHEESFVSGVDFVRATIPTPAEALQKGNNTVTDNSIDTELSK